MKKLIFILTYIFCVKAFSCPDMNGTWLCKNIDLKQDSKVIQMGLVLIKTLDGAPAIQFFPEDEVGEVYILDEASHEMEDEMTYTAACSATGVSLKIRSVIPKDDLYIDHTLELSSDKEGSLLNWTLDTNFFGKSINKMECRLRNNYNQNP